MHEEPSDGPEDIETYEEKSFNDHDRAPISSDRLKAEGRITELRKHARTLIERGERVTLASCRAHLESLGHDYSLKADQIGFALRHMRASGQVERYTNGQRVKVGAKIYRSIREAAEKEYVSVNTVRNRVKSNTQQFRSWKYVD